MDDPIIIHFSDVSDSGVVLETVDNSVVSDVKSVEVYVTVEELTESVVVTVSNVVVSRVMVDASVVAVTSGKTYPGSMETEPTVALKSSTSKIGS